MKKRGVSYKWQAAPSDAGLSLVCFPKIAQATLNHPEVHLKMRSGSEPEQRWDYRLFRKTLSTPTPALVNLLLIEDEARLADSLRRGLEEEGYVVDVAGTGEAGEDLALTGTYDVLVVDRRLPGRDGLDVIRHLRAAGKTEPVLMLTAFGEAVHKVEGLDAGADDYLAKPFSFDELLARLRALLRRPPLSEEETMLEVGPLRMDTKRRTVTLNGTRLNLRPKEYALLELLLRHPDEVHARAVIAERVWGDAFYLSDNTLDVTVSGLRQSLEWNRPAPGIEPQPILRIETIRGVGYRLVAGEAVP